MSLVLCDVWIIHICVNWDLWTMDMFLCDVWIIYICVNYDLWTMDMWYCINVVTSHWSVHIWYLVLHFGLCICAIICGLHVSVKIFVYRSFPSIFYCIYPFLYYRLFRYRFPSRLSGFRFLFLFSSKTSKNIKMKTIEPLSPGWLARVELSPL